MAACIHLRAPLGYWPGGTRPIGNGSLLPARSTITGLIGAACGIDRADIAGLDDISTALAAEGWGYVVRDSGAPTDQGRGDLVKADLTRRFGPILLADGSIVTARMGGGSKSFVNLRLRPMRSGIDCTLVFANRWADPFRAPVYPIYIGARACVADVEVEMVASPLAEVLRLAAESDAEAWWAMSDREPLMAHVQVASRGGGATRYRRVGT